MADAFVWKESTSNCWVARVDGVCVAEVRRPIKLAQRHLGWRVTDALGYCSSEYFGDDLRAAKRDAEMRVRERVERLARALEVGRG